MIDKSILLHYVQCITGENGIKHGADYFFHSPLHDDKTPSFKVNIARNKFHDFGNDAHGDVIDLVKQLHQCNYTDACIILNREHYHSYEHMDRLDSNTLGKEKIIVGDVNSVNLIDYAMSRGVSSSVLRLYCREIRLGKYYYIGFPSVNGGWELRNIAFKGCIGDKNYTFIQHSQSRNADLIIFEGFFDFLSFESYSHITHDVIVLNSTANVNKILTIIADYATIHCYCDNDHAGREATAVISCHHNHVIDHAPNYAQFNDVNDYLTHIHANVR